MNSQEKATHIDEVLHDAISFSDDQMSPQMNDTIRENVLAYLKDANLVVEEDWQDISEAPKEDPGLPGWPDPIIMGFAPDEVGDTLPSREGHWRGPYKGIPACWVTSIDPDVPYVPPQPTHFKPLPTIPEKDSPCPKEPETEE